ncbi:hypothetical protein TIFTF001_031490 [Ficus carica]|uniref:UspA domain-containing protein n=1 Tax=Ficus carica TaxID=3494 RepID=A0AA88DV32_FICCA|nr:hypothetical protein TIFTF001_031490 [Ficus carica]
MVLGIDDSEHSFYALEWTLDRYFADSRPNHPYKLVTRFGDFMTAMELDFKKRATRTVEKAKEVDDVNVEIVEGDPRNVICEAVDRHHASILVVGSHGYGVGGSRKRRQLLCSSCSSFRDDC